MTTGRVLAAKPRSASQISPGWGLIKKVQDFLFYRARANQVEDIVVCEVDYFLHTLANASRFLRRPFAKFAVEFLK